MVNCLVSIEGNIGSGKSTIMKYLKNLNHYQIMFVDEPVDEWLNIVNKEGKNSLQLFYENKKENSFWFQILAYITRLRNLLSIIENNDNKIIICERSIYTDHHVFAKMLYESDNLSEMEWKTYIYWFDTFKNKTKLDLILYVNTTPNECLERINKRNREEETNKISLEYLTLCHNKHTEWLSNDNTKMITINGNQIIDNIYKDINQVISNTINNFNNLLYIV